MSKSLKEIQAFEEHCAAIKQQTSAKARENNAQERRERIKRAQKDYAYFVKEYFPHYAKSECGDFHIKAANKVLKTPDLRAVMEWARGHAKSTHFNIMIPLWLKIQEKREINVMVLVGKSEDNADTLLSDLQAELSNNQRYIADFGEQRVNGSWENGEFVTKDGVAFFARGRGQSPRGLRHREFRPDYIVIDDLDDDELVENSKRVRKLVKWIKEALFGALDMGQGRFIMVGNRIHKNSVLANIAKSKGVYHMIVNALDKNGNPTWWQKYTLEMVQAIQEFMGFISFQKEYMNNPINEGGVFKNEWIKHKKALPLSKYDFLLAYCDPSFKSTNKNDFKAIKLWGKVGTQLDCIKAFVRQCSVTTMVKWFYDLHESIPEGVLCEYWMESNFMQDTLLDDFTIEGEERGYQLPIRGDKRKKPDKFQRIEAVSPLWERGFVSYNSDMKDDPDMQLGIEQTLAIEKGSSAPDDGPDADEGAIWLLQRRTRQSGFKPVIVKRTKKGR